MVNKEKYWEVRKQIEGLDLETQVELLNHMTDIVSKRSDTYSTPSRLGIIPVLKEEFGQENHYSQVILKRPFKLDPLTDKRSKFTITSEHDQTPYKVILHNQECWIKHGEFDLLCKNDIDFSSIKVMTYVTGLVSPYVKECINKSSLVDAYELHIIH